MGVVQTHLAKRHGFRMPHGFQYVAFVNAGVLMSKVWVTPKSTPNHLLIQEIFPQGLLRHEPRIAEVRNAALKLCRKARAVETSETAEGATEAQFSVKHVKMAVCVDKAAGAVGVTRPKGLRFIHGQSWLRSSIMLK